MLYNKKIDSDKSKNKLKEKWTSESYVDFRATLNPNLFQSIFTRFIKAGYYNGEKQEAIDHLLITNDYKEFFLYTFNELDEYMIDSLVEDDFDLEYFTENEFSEFCSIPEIREKYPEYAL